MFLKIAIRNVLRHKRRTILTVLTMSVGLMLFIFFDSLFLGIDKMFVNELIKYKDSSIVIYSKEYDQNRKAYPLDKPLKNIKRILTFAYSFKDVEGITFRTQFLAELIYLGKSKYIVATAIDPKTDIKVFNLYNKVKEGKFLSSDHQQYEVLLGKKLADECNIKVGDIITLSVQTKYGTYNALDFVVCGLLETTIPTINESSVLLTFHSAEELLQLENGITSIHIKVLWNKSESINFYAKKVSSIVENLKKKIGQDDYKIYTFKELYNDFILLMRQKKVSSFVIIFFLLLIGGVGVVNTILISVYERIKEIGLLLAFGFTPKQIKILFLLEGIVIGVIGGSIGCILGAVVNLWLVYFGWNLESFYGEQVTGLKASQIGMPIWGVLYGEWNISAFIFCFCFAVIISTISAYFPAKYASKLQIRECLKFI